MKFRVLGGPVEGSCYVEGKHNDKFEKLLKKIEKSLKFKGKLWEEYQLHLGRQVEGTKRVEPLPAVIKPSDTPDSLQLNQGKKDAPIFLMLRKKGVPVSNPTTSGQEESPGRTSAEPTVVEISASNTPREMSKPQTDVSTTPRGADSNLQSAAVSPGQTERSNPNEGYSYHDRLVAIYSKYEPAKLSKVAGTLRRFAGREEEVIRQLVKLYGPEPPIVKETPPPAVEPIVPAAAPIVEEPNEENSPATSPRTQERELPSSTSLSGEGGAASLSHTPGSTSLPSPREKVNEAYSYHDRLRAIYTVHDPKKINVVDGTLQKYKGKEEAVIRQLVKKYGYEPVIGVEVQLNHTQKSYRERLHAIYQKYDPEKLHTVDGTLQKYKGKEEQVIKSLVKRYGEEPPVQEDAKVAQYREKITKIITEHDPENLHMVEPLLENFAGREEVIIEKLHEKYSISEDKGEREEKEEAPKLLESQEQQEAPREEQKKEEEQPPKERTPPVTPTVVAAHTAPLASTPPTVTEEKQSELVETPHLSPPMAFIKTEEESNKDTEVAPPVVATTEPTSPVSSEEDHSATLKEGEVDEMAPRRFMSPTLEKWERSTEEGVEVSEVAKEAPPVVTTQVELNIAPVEVSPVPPPRTVSHRRAAAAFSGVLAERNAKPLLTTAYRTWREFTLRRKAAALLKNETVWKKEGAQYQMNDAVQPPYILNDLIQHLRENTASTDLPDEVVLGLRDVIDAVKTCLSASVVEVVDEKDKEMVAKFLSEWSSEKDMCPVKSSENLLLILKQAARFLRQVEDIMNISKRQSRQLVELTEELRALKRRSAKSPARQGDVSPRAAQQDPLVQQLTEENDRLRKELEKVYEEVAYPSSRTQSPRGGKGGASKSPRNAPSPVSRWNAGSEKSREAHTARLEQELAKARAALYKRKEQNDELRRQLEETERSHQRLKRDMDRVYSRRGSPVTRYRSRSQPNDISISPIPKVRPSMFSEPSPTKAGEGEEGVRLPISRISADMRLERGPCPNCLAPLTSVSTQERGPIDDTAAFCFNCKKPFTFGDLLVRDKVASATGF